MESRDILVTHARQYAGPGAVKALVAAGHRVLAHDASFADAESRGAYMQEHPGTTPLASQAVESLVAELAGIGCAPHAAVLNAVHPIRHSPVEQVQEEDLRSTFEDVVLFPIRLAQGLLPAMRRRAGGSVVFVTSARERRPEPGYAVPTCMRAAATAFARAMAIELAPAGIQVNVVAPNYLESDMYYPAARFVHDPEGRARIAELVPFGRLGKQEEIGELIAFLASGRAPFVTGQVIAFTGGWGV